jgi:hemerythrin-like domain-containing protein/uncharacterized protein (DUF2249 family)
MPRTLPSAAVVDVTTATPAPTDVLAAFDALAPGEMLLLRTAARPGAVLAALRGHRAGAFEWTPIVEGPEAWEVEIVKRAASAGPRRGVNEALGWDHDRLDGLELAATEAWNAGNPKEAARLHLRFAHGLLRHIRFEDTTLFPAFERATGMPPDHGPTAVMRVEHRAIEQLLQDLKDAISSGSRPGESTRDELRALLHQHNVKEENVLYPMLDRSVPAPELDAMVHTFQSMDPA